MSWTDERVDLLRKLWTDGLSASQIAAELSNGITRNAVIGKVHRLGLSGRVKANAPVVARPRVQQAAAAPRAAKPAPPRPMTAVRGNTVMVIEAQTFEAAAPAPRPMEEVVIPISERVTIMELREAMCRWPLGDPSQPDFRYCGARSDVGASYCAHHSRMAYQPAQDRRRERERRAQKMARQG